MFYCILKRAAYCGNFRFGLESVSFGDGFECVDEIQISILRSRRSRVREAVGWSNAGRALGMSDRELDNFTDAFKDPERGAARKTAYRYFRESLCAGTFCELLAGYSYKGRLTRDSEFFVLKHFNSGRH